MEQEDYDITATVQLRLTSVDASGQQEWDIRITDQDGNITESTTPPDYDLTKFLADVLWGAVGGQAMMIETDADPEASAALRAMSANDESPRS